MDLKQKVKSLSAIEAKTLKALDLEKPETMEKIADKSSLPIDSVRRAIEWLKEKGLAEVSEERTETIVLTAIGKSSLSKALPERLFVEALQQLEGKGSLDDVFKKSQLNRPEFNVAMGLAKRNAWISIQSGKETLLEFTGLEKDFLRGNYPLEKAMKILRKALN